VARKNTPTSGRVPGGGTVERSVAPDLTQGPLVLGLRRPDFTTAARIARKVNEALGAGSARALDPATVEVTPPEKLEGGVVALAAQVEALEVEADGRARVVVSERTGTVVAGEGVRLRPVAVAHGGLQITISAEPVVSQPEPYSRGQTVVQRKAEVIAGEEARGAVALPATSTVEDLARALDLLGVTPRDLVAILAAMKAAGALDADLEVI
jgi:flagellar P-ring protein precursor FlgI